MNTRQKYYQSQNVIKADMINEDEVKNQTDAVLWHLQNKGNITSWEAIKEYGATRLSAIIFNLRRRGYIIHSVPLKIINRFGKSTTIAKYTYQEVFNKYVGQIQLF
tara:strand:+ start:102 stop:419 length:318 start_codon:yes stop_codon:yes gene_type:complete